MDFEVLDILQRKRKKILKFSELIYKFINANELIPKLSDKTQMPAVFFRKFHIVWECVEICRKN